MSETLFFAMYGWGVFVCFLGIWVGYGIGRRSAFAEVQRWHLEDDEALSRRAAE